MHTQHYFGRFNLRFFVTRLTWFAEDASKSTMKRLLDIPPSVIFEICALLEAEDLKFFKAVCRITRKAVDATALPPPCKSTPLSVALDTKSLNALLRKSCSNPLIQKTTQMVLETTEIAIEELSDMKRDLDLDVTTFKLARLLEQLQYVSEIRISLQHDLDLLKFWVLLIGGQHAEVGEHFSVEEITTRWFEITINALRMSYFFLELFAIEGCESQAVPLPLSALQQQGRSVGKSTTKISVGELQLSVNCKLIDIFGAKEDYFRLAFQKDLLRFFRYRFEFSSLTINVHKVDTFDGVRARNELRGAVLSLTGLKKLELCGDVTIIPKELVAFCVNNKTVLEHLVIRRLSVQGNAVDDMITLLRKLRYRLPALRSAWLNIKWAALHAPMSDGEEVFTILLENGGTGKDLLDEKIAMLEEYQGGYIHDE